MAFTLDDLKGDVKPVTIYIKNQPIKMDLDTGALTNDLFDQYKDAHEDGDYDEMAAVFSQIVKKWDILEKKDGPMLPINGDALRAMPLEVLNKIWEKITDSIAPKSRKRKGN